MQAYTASTLHVQFLELEHAEAELCNKLVSPYESHAEAGSLPDLLQGCRGQSVT